MQLKNGCMAVKLLDFIGLCGEVPVSLVKTLPGYYCLLYTSDAADEL